MQGILNGQLLPVEEIKLGTNDLGISRGYAVFDFFRVNQNVPVFIEDHLERLKNSAREIRLPFPWKIVEIREMVELVISKNHQPHSAIKILITGGYSPDGFTSTVPNIVITQHIIKRPDEIAYTKGVKLISREYLRDSFEAKTTNYLMAQVFQQELQAENAFEVLYKYKGKYLETSRSNFFIVKNKTLITSQSKVLSGITRKQIMEIANLNYQVIQRDIQKADIESADEAFLSSTIKRIVPVVKIDDLEIGAAKPGAITNAIMENFERFEKAYVSFHNSVKTPELQRLRP